MAASRTQMFMRYDRVTAGRRSRRVPLNAVKAGEWIRRGGIFMTTSYNSSTSAHSERGADELNSLSNVDGNGQIDIESLEDLNPCLTQTPNKSSKQSRLKGDANRSIDTSFRVSKQESLRRSSNALSLVYGVIGYLEQEVDIKIEPGARRSPTRDLLIHVGYGLRRDT